MSPKPIILDHVCKPVTVEMYSGPQLTYTKCNVPEVNKLTLVGNCVLIDLNGYIFQATNYLKDYWALCRFKEGFAHIRLNDLEFYCYRTKRIINFSDLRKQI